MNSTSQAITDSTPRPLLSGVEVARRLQKSKTTVYKAMELGQIPSVQIGGRRMVSPAIVDKILAGERVSA